MLADSHFSTRTAGDREAGARCPHCSITIANGEQIAACGRCGAVQHVLCWHSKDGCGSFDCAPSRRILGGNRLPDLRITVDEVDRARPRHEYPVLGHMTAPRGAFGPAMPFPPADDRRSRLAVAAFLIAAVCVSISVLAFVWRSPAAGLLSLGGMIAGIAAVLIGSLALANIQQSRRRGTWLAAGGIVLGLLGTVGSIVLVTASSLPEGRLAVSIGEFEPDADSLNHMIPTIARAVRANALIETRIGGVLGGQGIGSAWSMLIGANVSALILTNRHVVDPEFGAKEAEPEKPGLSDGHLQVKLIGQPLHPGRVVWIAPDEIDLALVRVAVDGQGAEAAEWKPDTELIVGSEVFTVGNPEHLDWTHTRGSISQLRLQTRGDRKIHIIQTDASRLITATAAAGSTTSRAR